MQKTPDILTPVDKLQQQLAKQCFWDEVEQVLYIDARKFFVKEGVVTIIGWDNMMLNSNPIPDYPNYFKPMHWSKFGDFSDWLKQIPKWVQDSCGLFPTHQMTLLHYAGKYPQVLELLDHAPMLAWRLAKSGLEEPEIVALLSGKRTEVAEQLGWPGKAETIKFLTNLRLRWVNQQIAEQVEVCLMDEERLSALQALPRINSMALTLASRFPELIGTTLHQALAKLPCRPMQCKSMVALLEDAYALAKFLKLDENEVNKIGQCRFLVEVSQLYQTWQTQFLAEQDYSEFDIKGELTSAPKAMVGNKVLALSALQQHAWFVDIDINAAMQSAQQLYAWQDEEGVWAAMLTSETKQQGNQVLSDVSADLELGVAKMRGLENVLGGAKQFSTIHLWQAQRLKHTD